jgi:hypothetical protein
MLTAGGGGFAGVDVADDDHVDVHLLFTVGIVSVMSSMVGEVLFCGSEISFEFSVAIC